MWDRSSRTHWVLGMDRRRRDKQGNKGRDSERANHFVIPSDGAQSVGPAARRLGSRLYKTSQKRMASQSSMEQTHREKMLYRRTDRGQASVMSMRPWW